MIETTEIACRSGAAVALEDFVSTSSFCLPRNYDSAVGLEHVPFCFWLALELKPACVVEFGSLIANISFALRQAARLSQIDRQYESKASKRRDELETAPSVDFSDLQGYVGKLISVTPTMTSDMLSGHSVDLFVVDGRLAARELGPSLDNWLARLSPRGLVVVTRIAEALGDPLARKFWHDIFEKFPHFVFQHGSGLAVVGIGAAVPDRVHRLFMAAADGPLCALIRATYARLGAHIQALERAQQSEIELRRFDDERENGQTFESKLWTLEQGLWFETARADAAESFLAAKSNDLRDAENRIRHLERANREAEARYEARVDAANREAEARYEARFDAANREAEARYKANIDAAERANRETEARYQASVDAAVRRAKTAERQVADMLNSPSWRVTRPLRALGRLLGWR